MKRSIFALTSLGAAAFVVVAAAAWSAGPTTASLDAGAAAPETFQIDGVHSTVIFRIEHLGVAPFHGRFNEISGDFTFDESNPAAATFNITIKTASVDSGNEQRDRHLQSADFFNALEHPTITFKSTKVEAAEGGALEVTGDLMLHGVTKPVVVTVVPGGSVEAQGALKRGFSAETTIKRSEFGMTYGLQGDALGDEVTLMIGLEGARR